MELYEVETSAEKRLQAIADRNSRPYGGAIELLPLCNMNCKMCYVRKSRAEMDAEGRMLSLPEWLKIAQEARAAGVLFLLLTGGEPLLYPDFRPLYARLTEMGFVVTINTNGTLIDESWADFFAARPCRRINITLYGKDDATYARLCGNPKGFSQVMRAAQLLKERNVSFRFTCSVTADNQDDLPQLFQIAGALGVPLQPATYMSPGLRRGVAAGEQVRLDPETAARLMVKSHELQRTPQEMQLAVQQTLLSLFNPPVFRGVHGFTCHAGHSGFWLNWKGEMLPCGMMNEPKASTLESGFEDAWQQIVRATSVVHYSEECVHCRFQNLCRVCPASLVAETGAYDRRPDYVCRYTREMIRAQIEYLCAGEEEKARLLMRDIGL